jgi:hypothetical protein
LRGSAIAALKAANIVVDVLSPDDAAHDGELSAALQAVLLVNEALLHRVVTGRPFSVWKYAMTLDGKIASSSGHSAWVTGAPWKNPILLLFTLFSLPRLFCHGAQVPLRGSMCTESGRALMLSSLAAEHCDMTTRG